MDVFPSFDLTQMPAAGQMVPMDPRGDAALAVKFYERAGTDHIQILFPGDERSVIDRPATEADKIRFPAHWTAYEGGGEHAGQIRLETVVWMDEGLTNELRRVNVYTVEQLAALPDEVILQMRTNGLMELRVKARAHLEEVKSLQHFAELKHENDDLRRRLEALEKQGARGRGKTAA